MLRPFFRLLVPADSPDILKAESWKYGGYILLTH